MTEEIYIVRLFNFNSLIYSEINKRGMVRELFMKEVFEYHPHPFPECRTTGYSCP